MTDTVKIEGLKGVLDGLAQMEAKAQRKTVNAALRAGARPIQAAARRNAAAVDDPTTPERIASQIATRAVSKKALRKLGADAGVSVGVLNSHNPRADAGVDEYHYAWFVEEGTSTVRARPFMRPAAESENGAAFSAIADSLQQAIFGR